MQILPSVQSTSSALPGTTAAPDKNPAATRNPPDAAPTRLITNQPQENIAADESTSVAISAETRIAEARETQVPIYAEIWKGAIKLAQIDIHGHVISFSGLVPSGGGGLAGPLLAAQRTVQVAQQTGGEIRSAGQSLDGQTLLMRARLEKAYTL